jgi:ligand-binding SRPBCC domain-containing protein
MRVHELELQQRLPVSVPEAWSFFSTPLNLARITPPTMRFVILPPIDPAPVYAGQRMRYSVRPLFGIPLKWETLIGEVDAPYRFVDTQLKGPFALWEHTHTFVRHGDGTMMTDHLRYALPLGLLGDFAHALVIKDKVENIFVHRRKTLERLFPTKAA